jgi:hypothetical protein
MPQDPQPLACSLPSDAMASRIAWLKDLKSRSLLDHWRDGGSLHLLFASDARRDVEDLVAKESACCGFLAFAVSDTARAVHLTVTPPREAAGFIDELLRHFEPE